MTALKAGWKNCTHHFIYPPPSGSVAIGKCKKCGKVDESKNYVEIQGWNNKFLKRNKK